ncbi:unnamed protein product [Danaus chrysippus]|uniref:(African queen) hypothetical protein n=1 Tax=Danaus chrysippus TaxID=151541 RepID=A0A8J2RAV4_9NEOP|nr:unnamed protein product [Danaus chrysippus]
MLLGQCRSVIGILKPELMQLALTSGIKYFPPPKNYDDIVIPERPRLRVFDKVPLYPPNLKPPKMQKRLRYMRGPETVHNTLQLKQYGVVVHDMLRIIAERLPFKAEPISQELLEKKAASEKWCEENNTNKFTLKYIIQNNMGGCHRFISKYDHKWYGKYF